MKHMKPGLMSGTLAVFMAMAALPGLASAAGGTAFELPEQINLVGLGVGQAPDYSGSDDYETAVAPMGRYYFSGNKYIQLLGPQLTLNLLDNDVWQFGPELLYRFGRDNDVDDVVVSQMRKIDGTLMAGAYVAATLEDPVNPLKRWVFSADLVADTGDTNSGLFGTAFAKYWFPVGKTLLNLSGGITYGSDDYNNTYYGVYGSDIALYPSLGGFPYRVDGGINSVVVLAGGVMPLSKTWSLAAGVRYERLLGDIADSPVVDQRGDANQWIYGIALGYTW